MKAPEKIYVALDEINDLALDRRFDYPICIEYTRTDAFVEKALRWMISQGGINDSLSREMIKDFKNYMEGG